ncbi:MAG: ribonuclease H-like domain-containing protein [Pirellulaceae bacterium]
MKSARALPNGREVENAAGRHWLVEEPLSQIWSGADAISKRLVTHNGRKEVRPQQHFELTILDRHLPRSAMFVDLETCGFAGSAVFLIGIVHHHQEQLTLRQLLARNYAEERSILQAYWDVASDQHALVSFNGKCFDWPMLLDRTTLHHLPHRVPEPFVHCDLLHHARRKWKDWLPNCKLQTLERYICGRRRVGDIPGRDIPQAYHDYVRNGDAWEIRSILHHNALDLVTLVQLSLGLLGSPQASYLEDQGAGSKGS